jgi:hypothetical protein
MRAGATEISARRARKLFPLKASSERRLLLAVRPARVLAAMAR